VNFTKTHSTIIVALVLLSILGLSAIQFSWLQGAIAIRKTQIQEQLTLVMEKLESGIDLDLEEGMIASSHNQHSISYLLLADIEANIDSILHEENLYVPYEYGISSCKSKDYKWMSNEQLEDEIMEGCQIRLSGCKKDFIASNGKKDHLHLYAYFPQKTSLIFKEMSLAIGSSILFMLLLIGAFAYMLNTIFRQKKLSEMKNDFINNLTHEFKTPIASISLAARTLNRLPPVQSSDKALSYVHLIDQEGKRLENHIDKVLQMATIDSGNFALDKKWVDLHDIIRKVKDSFSIILEKREGDLELDLSAKNPIVSVDAMHIFNVLYNLVDNAIKYNKNKPLIGIESYSSEQDLLISVKDNGIGINKEDQAHIYERFYRPMTGNVHDTKGFGLGLTYVKRMIEAHHGSIELQSQLGQGTTFNLTFPR